MHEPGGEGAQLDRGRQAACFEDGLRTDESGKLSIQGIPHGEYRWTANGSSGTFDLAAGELFNRRLILP